MTESQAHEPQYVEYILSVDADRTDEAIARLQGRGIEYVWIDSPIETIVTENGYGFHEIEQDKVTIRAYEEVTGELNAEVLHRLRDEVADWLGDLSHTVEAVVPQPVTEDPAYEFTAVEVREGLVIRPPWDEERGEGETTLLIEPAAAFGTGLHPTTRHCLELIDDLVKPGDAVADLGAGSGILSLLARIKGASPVFAVDFNPSAESTIKYHMELNQTPGIEIRIGDASQEFQGIESQFDLVAVNISGMEVIQLAPLCMQIVKPNGVILLSGIVEWIEEQVVTCYQDLGYQVIARRKGDEWVTLAVEMV